jgi:hypothetical protein
MGSPVEILRNVTTGTITTMLLKGIRRSWMAAQCRLVFLASVWWAQLCAALRSCS